MPQRNSSDNSSSKDSGCGLLFSPSRTNSHPVPLSARKVEIKINVYDLLPPGKISSILWTLGSGLLHSGVVIGNREYAYGGHDRRGLTGVYYTKPKQLPPGGTFRTTILAGFTLLSQRDLEKVIHEASEAFQGTSYNLLTKNCNHFTSYLVDKLTGRPAPKWLNRAAGIGVALPCVVPRDWISPPEYEDYEGEGELVDEDDNTYNERSGMLGAEERRRGKMSKVDEDEWGEEVERIGRGSISSSSESYRARYHEEEDEPPRLVKLKDVGDGHVPPAERAPLPHRISSS